MRKISHKNIYLSKEELKKLFEVIKKYNKDHYIMFYLTYFCALRVSELINLKIKNYDKNSWELRIERLKWSVNKTYILPLNLRKYIENIIKKRENNEHIFITQHNINYHRSRIYILFNRYIKLAKIDDSKWFIHILKHTICTHLINEWLSIQEVQNWMWHKNINNTMLYYTASSKEQEKLQKKVWSLFNNI